MLTRPDKRQTVASKGPRNYVDMPHLPPQHENPPPTPLAWPGLVHGDSLVPADVGERSVLIVVTNTDINRRIALEIGQVRLNQTKKEIPYYCSLKSFASMCLFSLNGMDPVPIPDHHASVQSRPLPHIQDASSLNSRLRGWSALVTLNLTCIYDPS